VSNRYQEPSLYVDGQIIGRSNVGLHADNDNYFNGLADRYVPILYSPRLNGLDGRTIIRPFDGYIYLRADAMRFHWSFWAYAGSGATTTTIYIVDDNSNGYEADTLSLSAGNSSTAYGNVDLSSISGYTFSAGWHQVYLEVVKVSGDTGAYAQCWPPFCTYTSTDYTYPVPTYVYDGLLSRRRDFNKWRQADMYFWQCKPVNPAFLEIQYNLTNAASPFTIWDGFIRHYHEQIRYKLYCTNKTYEFYIIYDYGGSNETTEQIEFTSSETQEGTFDLPAGTFNFGETYRVAVRVVSGNGNVYSQNKVIYLFAAPKSGYEGHNPQTKTGDAEYFNVMADLSPGAYVYGNTTGYSQKLVNLTYNDVNLFERLCWNATVGRIDWAVRNDVTTYITPGTITLTHRLKRIYDTLYYRGTSVVMRWGDGQSKTLEDGAGTVDLRQVPDLLYGQQYYLEGSVDYAAEI